jgi:simple sugar transport system permease protein
MDDLVFILAITAKSSIPVLLASLGEIITERSGILNLGLEGMMLMGALAGFVIGQQSGSLPLALAGAMVAGMLLALIHAFFCIHLQASQVISGLSITILATGLSSFLGRPFIGRVGPHLEALSIGSLAAIPLIGPVLAQQNGLTLVALLLAPLTAWMLAGSWPGLYIRAVGEDPEAADAAGVPVVFIRYACTLFGGAMAGLGGAYLSLAYTPGWKEGMTGGQGWIAIAMVIFATWHPGRALYGAFLFGGLTAIQFYFQATGTELVPAWILRLLPYLLTVGILFLVTALKRTHFGASPAALGQPFSRG